MATPTHFDNDEAVFSENRDEQWSEESCSKNTFADQSRGCADDNNIYQNDWKDSQKPPTEASWSEPVCGDPSRHGTDDDDVHKDSWGNNDDTEPEQATDDGGSEKTDSADENAYEGWEYATEESVSETTDDDQTCEEYVDEAQLKDFNEEFKDPNDPDSSSSLAVKGDWYAEGALIPGMAGYVDKCKNPENDADRVKSLAEIKYDGLPFVTKHYFLHHALHILEAICFRTGERRFRKYLDDPVWKRLNLVINPWSDNPDIRRAYGDWLTEDGVEVMWWVWFYGEKAPGMPPTSTTGHILNPIYYIRNAALHRGDEGGLDFQKWKLAMQVPKLLEDDVGKKEMADLAECVLGDGPMDEDVRAGVERKMYTPRLSTTKYQLLERIQTLLEESCYNLAVKKIPDVLEMNGWDCAEKVELPKWIGIFEKTEVVEYCDDLAKDFFRGRDSTILTNYIIDLLHRARMEIRKRAAHRLPISTEQLIGAVHTAIRTAVLLSDWPRAIEIEVVSEMLLAGTSRQEVLDRLERSYKDGKAQTNYERRRRHELRLFLRDQQGKEDQEEDEGQGKQRAECDVEEEMVWPRSTWSPSMHECLRIVQVVEVVKCIDDVNDLQVVEGVKCIGDVNEDKSEKLASETWEVRTDSDDTSWGTSEGETGGELC